MSELLVTLLPLIIGSAVLPIQITISILLLRSRGGVASGAAWVGGMIAVRLVQGVLFGFVLATGVAEAEGPGRPGPIASTLLLIVGVVFLVGAAKKLLAQPDEDAPPPRWMTLAASATPASALLMGAALVAINPKLWAFTMAALGVIAEAGLGQGGSVAAYLAFVVLAESIHLVAVGAMLVAPQRAMPVLDRASDGLARYSRQIMVALSVVFGVWLLYKALAGLGVL